MRDSDRYERVDRYEDRDRARGPPPLDDDRHYRPRDRYDDMPARNRDRRRFDSASYYDEYRPRASENVRYSSDHGNRSRQSSPKKKSSHAQGGGRGYRRGGADADLD